MHIAAKIGKQKRMKILQKIAITTIFGGVVLLQLSADAFSQNLQLNVYVSQTIIGLNEQFELNMEFSGPDANDVNEPGSPDLSGFATFVGSSSSSNIQIVNGKMNVTKIYSHHYIAQKEGTFTIPAIQIKYKRKTLTSNPIQIRIVKKQNRRSPRNATPNQRGANSKADLSDLLFLKAHVNKRQVYQNEPVVVTYKIYTAVNVTNYGVTQLPNTVGFWSEEFQQPSRLKLTTEILNGRQFRVAEIKRFALFPQGPGKKTLDPMVVDCEVQLPRRRSNRDIFDDFFNDSFFSRSVRRTISSNVIEINVLPLPVKNKPLNFSGLVGKYSVRAAVDKHKVKTNEAVTLNIKISGTGNVKIISQPKMNFSADFEVYAPKVHEDIKRKNNSVSGSKTFEYVIIPRFPGKQHIKPYVLTYFDPVTRSYRSIKTAPIDIDVAKGNDQFSSIGVVNSKEDVKFIGKDIRFIQMRLPEFKQIGPMFYKKTIFYFLFIIPLIVFFGADRYQKHVQKMSSNVAYARSRKANQMALKRLRAAEKAMSQGEASVFYSEVSKALFGYIGDKLNRASAGLIIEDVEKELFAKNIQEESIHRFVDCVKSCDFNRFAPGQSDEQKMAAFFDTAKHAIVDLEKQL